MEVNWTYILVAMIGLIPTGIGWLNERYKRKESEVNNAQKIVSMYQKALSDFESKYEKDIASIRSEVNSWKEKYIKLKRDFDAYRRKHN